MLEAPPRTTGMCERDSVLHGKAIDLLQGGRTLYCIQNICFTFQLSLHPNFTTQQSPIYCPMRGPDSCFQPVASTRSPKHYLMCVFQKAVDLLFDHCCFKKKLFSFCGIGGLSLLLGSQYNYQRLQAAMLPGIECLSQGYYYFHAQLFGRRTQHLNNLVHEAHDSKMNLGSVFLLHIRTSVLAANKVLSWCYLICV